MHFTEVVFTETKDFRPLSESRLASLRTLIGEIVAMGLLTRPNIASGFSVHPVETVLNNPRAKRIDKNGALANSIAFAIAEYEAGRLIVLLDDQQMHGLDTQVTLNASSQLSFIPLRQMAGG